MSSDFEVFLKQLSETNTPLSYFVDFDKVCRNVDAVAMRLHQLNYLVGHPNLEEGIRELFEENPRAFNVLGILIAVREPHKKRIIVSGQENTFMSNYFKSPEQIYQFIRRTGLEKVLKDNSFRSLVDYVFGVEVGMDTNARKNRSGRIMELAVQEIFDVHDIAYETQVKADSLLDFDELGEDNKQFDLIITTSKTTYLIEVNYYNSQGSKPLSSARSFVNIAKKVNAKEGYTFVYITDGPGWLKSKKTLKEIYQTIPFVFNLKTLPKFIASVKSSP